MTLIASHSNSLLAGLRSFWKLDGNLDDSYGLNSYVAGAPFAYTTGLHGNQALNLAATIGNHSFINTNRTLPLEQSVRTMNIWFKDFTPAVTGIKTIVGYGDDSYSQLFVIGLGSDGKLFFWGSTTNTTGNATINHSQWNMLTVIYDGINVKLYINGILDTSTILKLNTIERYVMFGKGITYDSGDGLIQDFGIWGRILTPKEINTLYNNGLGIDITAIPIEENLLTSTDKGKIIPLNGVDAYVQLPATGIKAIGFWVWMNPLFNPGEAKILLRTVSNYWYSYGIAGLDKFKIGTAPIQHFWNLFENEYKYQWVHCYAEFTAPVNDYIRFGINNDLSLPNQMNIANIRTYNTALTDAEILQVANNNTSGVTSKVIKHYNLSTEDNLELHNCQITGITNSTDSIGQSKRIDLNGRNAYFQIPLVGIRSMTFMYNGDIAHKGYLLDMRPPFFAWLYWASYNANNIPVVKVNNINVSGTIASVWSALNTNSWNHVYLEFSTSVTTNIFMGSRYTGDEVMYASFKDISTFNNSLTAQEVTDLYNGNTTTTTSKLVKHYDLTIKDDLTLVNTTIQAQKLIDVGKNAASYRKGCLNTSAIGGMVGFSSVYPPIGLDIVNTISAECWVRPTFEDREMVAICRWENGTTPESTSWLLGFYSNNKVMAIIRKADLSAQTLMQSGTTLSSGVWHHIAFTYDGAMMRLYINGVETDSFATTGNLNIPIGTSARLSGINFPGYHINGDIDNCRIWNKVLTASEISLNKNRTFDTAVGLVVNWKLDDAGFYLLKDSSGNNNHVQVQPPAQLKSSNNPTLL